MLFSRDADLARFEAGVFGDWHLRGQAVCGGANGIVAGTQFTAAGVDFAAARVAAGDVLWLQSADSTIAAAYEIDEVLDSGHLEVGVLRSEADEELVPVAAASGLTWRIVKYAVQAYETMWEMSRRLGLRPGCAGADHSVEDVVNAEALRQASIFGTLAMILEAVYTGAEGQEVVKEKAAAYRKRFEKAMEGLRVLLDTDGDGGADGTAEGGTITLKRT
ncbi:MAG: hypothetical protein LLF76_14465 [Planctomycetaceae bacterium]|nr:hypothetical protein [Planctomycetaceae bacterium]